MTESELPGDRPATDAATPEQEAGEVSPAPPEAEAPPEEAQGDLVADELSELVADLRRERDQYLDLAQRAKADFDNYRKRAAREAAEAESRGKASLARSLLPSIDDLERALGAAEQGSDVARGIELVHGELRASLERAGVESYDPSGERFDPNFCEAISTRPAGPGGASGQVVETLERGYRLDGQVIRPARVIVSD